MSTFLWNFCTGSCLKLNLVINAFFLYCKLFMYLKISDIISFVKLDKSRCISLLLCFWHINCPILMVIYPNNYSNFRTIMEVIMKNKWLLCILLMLFLPFGLFAQVAPPLEKQLWPSSSSAASAIPTCSSWGPTACPARTPARCSRPS